MQSTQAKKVGFYLHTSWKYEYPFAVRSWQREDFDNWFSLMNQMGLNLLMLWPLCEVLPAPLSDADREVLLDWKEIVDDAAKQGLETWLVQSANCVTKPEIAEQPFPDRHFYPHKIDLHLDDDQVREEYFAHRAAMMKVLDNADGYVTIDGDPGSYPKAKPEQLLQVFEHDRKVLDEIGREDAVLIPWLWSGWGTDWDSYGVWQEPIEPLTTPVVNLINERLPAPWTLLPGRSIREDWANGRANFAVMEKTGLVEKSVLLCYEIVEFEPTPPAVILQFDDIRRVLREEAPLLEKSRGVVSNAQQPVMALPNLFFFAQAARDPGYLNRTDEEVLRDFAILLGGDADILLPAWQSGYLPLEQIPGDLPTRLRSTALVSAAASGLPGGPQKYLDILASWVEARVAVLRTCSQNYDNTSQAAAALACALHALLSWWQVHRYVFTGDHGDGFQLRWTHELLLAPLQNWCKQFESDRAELKDATLQRLTEMKLVSQDTVKALDQLLA